MSIYRISSIPFAKQICSIGLSVVVGFVLLLPIAAMAADTPKTGAPLANGLPSPASEQNNQATPSTLGASPQQLLNSASPYMPVKELPTPLTYLILIGMTVTWVCSLGAVSKTLRNQNWSLKTALEEEVDLPAGTPPPAAGSMPPMAASTSRLIALIGTIVLGTFFIAVGYYVVWQLCNGQPIQNALNAWSFFLTGATLFLPYGINKASSVFK